jgi:endonuclease YncB( thermonuclease family)
VSLVPKSSAPARHWKPLCSMSASGVRRHGSRCPAPRSLDSVREQRQPGSNPANLQLPGTAAFSPADLFGFPNRDFHGGPHDFAGRGQGKRCSCLLRPCLVGRPYVEELNGPIVDRDALRERGRIRDHNCKLSMRTILWGQILHPDSYERDTLGELGTTAPRTSAPMPTFLSMVRRAGLCKFQLGYSGHAALALTAFLVGTFSALGAVDGLRVAGQATIVDGDTLELRVIDSRTAAALQIAGVRTRNNAFRVRLFGIDAPESGQTCSDRNGKPYFCGSKAAFALADLIGRDQVVCTAVDRDRYGRLVARCRAGSLDLGAEMVRHGQALDFPKYSHGAYAEEQADAQDAREGLFSGQFMAPWLWRAQGGH